jgi:hypothetical protein
MCMNGFVYWIAGPLWPRDVFAPPILLAQHVGAAILTNKINMWTRKCLRFVIWCALLCFTEFLFLTNFSVWSFTNNHGSALCSEFWWSRGPLCSIRWGWGKLDFFCVCFFLFNTTFIEYSPLGVLWNYSFTECACPKLEKYFERNLDSISIATTYW